MTAREAFFSKYLNAAKTAANGTKVFPSVVLAVAALESANGTSKLTREANNFFGFKAGSSWKGDTYIIDTIEYVTDPLTGAKVQVTEKATFRAYPLPIDSFKDYVRLISTAPRYAKAAQATNALDQIAAIREAGYATDPNYVNKVAAVMDSLKDWIDTLKKKAQSHLLGEQYYCFWGIDISLK